MVQQDDQITQELLKRNQSQSSLITTHIASVADIHGIGPGSSIVGTATVQTLSNKKFGTATDNTTFEANGFIKANGTGMAYEDIQFNMTPKAVGAGHPTLDTFKTDFEEWSYGVGNHSNSASQEAPHWWAEGTAVSFHIHWSTGIGNYVNGDKVQWQLKVSAANLATSQPFTAFPAAVTLTGETSFTTTVAPFSHVLTPFSAYTLPAEWTKIGAQIKVRLERIAKTAGGTDPGTPPFVLQVGCHALADTNGSRSIGSK